jgi:hypothetical protein
VPTWRRAPTTAFRYSCDATIAAVVVLSAVAPWIMLRSTARAIGRGYTAAATCACRLVNIQLRGVPGGRRNLAASTPASARSTGAALHESALRQKRHVRVRQTPSVLAPFAVWLRTLAPLAFTGTKGCSVQGDDAANAQDHSGQDADEREQEAGMNLAIQPLTGNESESDADRQREAELRRNGKRLRRGQSRPFQIPDWCASVLHTAWSSIERHGCRNSAPPVSHPTRAVS